MSNENDDVIEVPVLGGRCLDLTVGRFTRADLLTHGLSEQAADELMAFAERLAAKRKRPVGTCGLCGEPMPPGEEMFMYHGYSGPCPVSLARDPHTGGTDR